MPKRSRPTAEGMPFGAELGQRWGAGQDNQVYRMVGHAAKPHLRPPIGAVLKINHEKPRQNIVRHPDEREAVKRGLEYKKNKYELLKLFLGDFVPDTGFVMSRVHEGQHERYAELTVQREVPRISLHQLTEKQRKDPRLTSQIVDLMSKLQYMYDVLGEANARTRDGVSLDGTLNLGGVSDDVRAESLDYGFTAKDAQGVIDKNESPNLLVNPETMQLFCVDFDQGQWTEGMSEAKSMAERIVADDKLAQVGRFAIGA